MKKQRGFQLKLILSTIVFIILVSGISLSVVYYWSFYHFSTIFEDRVIDDYTFRENKEMGVKNEWILGVTTDSIDVVESIHDEKVANVILNNAKEQTKPEQLYKDTIDGKHLLYMIRLDSKNGETVYKYSIIKDIYAEIFPQIAISFIIFSLIIILISIWYTRSISKQVYNDISKLRKYTLGITQGTETEPLDIKTNDQEFQNLMSDLKIMKDTIDKEAAIRQSTLQYISHEMKTPIMIIEGYVTSAIDKIYPKGTLEESLDTILNQTERMKQKVQDLITVVRIEAPSTKEKEENIYINGLVEEIFQSLTIQTDNKRLNIKIPDDLVVRANREKLKILFENLIINQIKYSEDYMSISCKIHNSDIRLYFYNNGAKIEPYLKEKLFQPFVKGYNGSSGLGLSICKTIIGQLDGKISLIDTEKGSLFEIYIPDRKV